MVRYLTVAERRKLSGIVAFASAYLEEFSKQPDCPDRRRREIENLATTLGNAEARLTGDR